MKDYTRHFTELSWMITGTTSQQHAYKALQTLNLFHDLSEYNPVFAGTIPIGVDIDGSDIDILCEVTEFSRFQNRLRECFESQKNFSMTEKYFKDARSVLARFDYQKFRIEIFGQRRPSVQQDAFQHLIAEAKLLELGGPASSEAIRKLKIEGHKTEPAFAEHFGIKGDAFIELLKLAPLTLAEIKVHCHQGVTPSRS